MTKPARPSIEEVLDRTAALIAMGEAELGSRAAALADEFLDMGEAVLEAWLEAKGAVPTEATSEGFRLLALHRQGATGDPSFNACRETCRELAYHYNLLTMDGDGERDRAADIRMMALVANHLLLFISGKIADREIGDFCCSSKPLRNKTDNQAEVTNA